MEGRTTMLVATAALVIAGCGGASEERTGATPSTTSQASVTVAPKPAWVPRRFRDRFAARGPNVYEFLCTQASRKISFGFGG